MSNLTETKPLVAQSDGLVHPNLNGLGERPAHASPPHAISISPKYVQQQYYATGPIRRLTHPHSQLPATRDERELGGPKILSTPRAFLIPQCADGTEH